MTNALREAPAREPQDWAAPCLAAVSVILSMLFISQVVSASDGGDEESAMKRLISDNEDVMINEVDLAFLLATHGYDAVPKDGYVEVCTSGAVCRLVPNGKSPGLADEAPAA